MRRLARLSALAVVTGLGASPAAAIDPFFPTFGNNGINVIHYDLDLEVAPEPGKLDGSAKLVIIAEKRLEEFSLDLAGLDVSRVTVNGASADFEQANDKLIVMPRAPIRKGAVFKLSVAYAGRPDPIPDPTAPGSNIELGWLTYGTAQGNPRGNLQAAHAWHPFAVTWDDHEVENDYAAEHAEEQTPVEEFLRRRAAAYQAYYEHMPLRPTARLIGPDMTLYTTLTFGDLASFMMLDNRQYRSDQACQGPERFGGQLVEDCAEREQEDRSMLGPEQERWLRGRLSDTQARWKVIGQQMLMAQLEQKQGEGEAWWSDGWDGYPAGHQRILSQIAEQKIEMSW
jgi:PhoD-like phosphatase